MENGGFPPIMYINTQKDIEIKKERFFSPEPFKMANIKTILTSTTSTKPIINIDNNDINVVDDF